MENKIESVEYCDGVEVVNDIKFNNVEDVTLFKDCITNEIDYRIKKIYTKDNSRFITCLIATIVAIISTISLVVLLFILDLQRMGYVIGIVFIIIIISMITLSWTCSYISRILNGLQSDISSIQCKCDKLINLTNLNIDELTTKEAARLQIDIIIIEHEDENKHESLRKCIDLVKLDVIKSLNTYAVQYGITGSMIKSNTKLTPLIE